MSEVEVVLVEEAGSDEDREESDSLVVLQIGGGGMLTRKWGGS